MWERGYSQPTMTAKLTLSAEATGEVEIVARDGKTTLRKKVTIEAAQPLDWYVFKTPYFYRLSELNAGTVRPVLSSDIVSVGSFLSRVADEVTVNVVHTAVDPENGYDTYTYKSSFGGVQDKTTTLVVTYSYVEGSLYSQIYEGGIIGDLGVSAHGVQEQHYSVIDGVTTGHTTGFSFVVEYPGIGIVEIPTTFVSNLTDGSASGLSGKWAEYIDANNYIHVLENFANAVDREVDYRYQGKTRGTPFSCIIPFSFFKSSDITYLKFGREK
jgi:hypothetical protein